VDTSASTPCSTTRMTPLLQQADRMGLHVPSCRPPTDRTWVADGVELHGLDWGSADQPPLVLLHGVGQNAQAWDLFALAMRDRFHVVAPDLRGHGDSDRSPPASYRADTFANDLRAIVELEGWSQVGVGGLSLGGVAALTFAGRWPHLVGSLVLVDSAIEQESPGALRILRAMSRRARFDDLDALVAREQSVYPHQSEGYTRSTVLNNLRPAAEGGWEWRYDGAFRGAVTPRSVFDRTEILGLARAVTAPTLVVRGARSSVLTEAGAAELEALIPEATIQRVPDAGHLVPADNPLGFERRVRPWLIAQQPVITT